MGDARELPIAWEDVAGDRGGPLAWIEYAALRAALATGSRLPRSGQRALVEVLARTAKLADVRHTRSARAFVAQALGERTESEREELVLASWRHLISLALEDARFNRRVAGPQLLEHFELDVHDDVRRAFASGRGGLGVTAHVGNWEALPPVFAALGGRPLYVVSRPPRNRPLSRFAQRTREVRGYRLIHRRGAVEDMRKILGAGGWVGLMLDQRARRHPVLAPFFGRLAQCERGVGVLARRMRVPIVIAACYRTNEPWRYRAVLPRVIEPEEIAHSSPEEIAALVNRELERLILAAPEQYFWLHDRYYKAPAAAGTFAAAR